MGEDKVYQDGLTGVKIVLKGEQIKENHPKNNLTCIITQDNGVKVYDNNGSLELSGAGEPVFSVAKDTTIEEFMLVQEMYTAWLNKDVYTAYFYYKGSLLDVRYGFKKETDPKSLVSMWFRIFLGNKYEKIREEGKLVIDAMPFNSLSNDEVNYFYNIAQQHLEDLLEKDFTGSIVDKYCKLLDRANIFYAEFDEHKQIIGFYL